MNGVRTVVPVRALFYILKMQKIIFTTYTKWIIGLATHRGRIAIYQFLLEKVHF